RPLNAPVVGMAATPTGTGYWEVASDGGIFAFGSAQFSGSMGGSPLNAPVVAMAAAPTGKGYWEVASDGGIFAFGSAQFSGSMGGRPLNAPVVGMAAAPTGKGYWEAASDGGIFAFGTAVFYGSLGGQHNASPVIGVAATPMGGGYWLLPAPFTLSAVRSVLAPATTAPVVNECSEELRHYQDGTFGPLTCDAGHALNVLAWNLAAQSSPSLLGLGPTAAPGQVSAALCADLKRSTIPLETEAFELLQTYTGQSFGLTRSSVFAILQSC
ncbi:MAG: hypothetical protein ACYDHU_12995, partial [Acidimicrobiales bacterium]